MLFVPLAAVGKIALVQTARGALRVRRALCRALC